MDGSWIYQLQKIHLCQWCLDVWWVIQEKYNYCSSSEKQSFTTLFLPGLLIYNIIICYLLLQECLCLTFVCLSIVFCPKEPCLFVPLPLCRCVYVGDLDVRHQAFPGGEEQRRDWQDRERRAIGYAASVPAHPLQSDDQMLVVWPEQATAIHRTENTTQVIKCFCQFVLVCFHVLNVTKGPYTFVFKVTVLELVFL